MSTAMVPAIVTDRQAWLAKRRQSVGASEAAAVLGLSPWKTPLEVYMDKAGLLPERPPTPRMQWGLRMEPVLMAAYREFTGREVGKAQEFVAHPKAPWMTATLDIRAMDRVVELKRVGSFAAAEFGPDGSSQIPEHYYLQVQQQMACTGMKLADLAALIGDDDFRIFTIEANQEIGDKLIEVERDFMDRVARHDPPLPDFQHPSTAELLAMIEPDIALSVELGYDVQAWVQEYESLGRVKSDADKARDEVKARILHAMGAAGLATIPNGQILTRKTTQVKAYSVEAKSYVRFAIKNPRKQKETDE